MHFIQKHILDQLRTTETMQYSAMKQDEIESGHFRYHLRELEKAGYVERLDRGLYRLTTPGQTYVDKLSERGVNPKAMPKVITYTLLKDGDKVLLQEKQKQPYMHLLNMIGGKLHEGEIARDAAAREVHEKTGVVIETPDLAGVFEILISKESDLLTHVIAFVFTANVHASDFASAALTALGPAEFTDGSAQHHLAPDYLPILAAIKNAKAPIIRTLELRL